MDIHCLRVTYATLLAEQNIPPKLAMKLMQHSSIGMTFERYAKVRPEQEREAVAGLRLLPREGDADAQAAAIDLSARMILPGKTT